MAAGAAMRLKEAALRGQAGMALEMAPGMLLERVVTATWAAADRAWARVE